ncbi:uncharacterized protein LOC143287905 [Babylonia areolata]|uniref:uncharacterized protein LOC143287905 n=1 Tax=Babylonia areolata TaxID=304850 RepID=UPI003FD14396
MTSEAPPSSSGGHCPIPAFMFRGIRLNPDRALEPARRKLETLEAQRVVAVFEETIRRVQIVTALPYIMQNMDRFSVPLGTELVELMRHHSVVISSYDEIHQELNKQLEKRASKKTSPAPVEDTKESEEAREEVDIRSNI